MKRFLTLLLVGCLSLPLTIFSQMAVKDGYPRAFVVELPALDPTDGVTPETALTVTSFSVSALKKDKLPVTVTIAACVYADETLTSTGTNPANNDTVTIGPVTREGAVVAGTTVVYTFKTTLTGAANEIKIAASAALTLDNLKCAINDSGCSEGTDYGTGTTAHPVANATTNTDTTQLVVANIPGSAENSIVSTESSAQLSWGAATLTGGIDNCMVHHANGYYWFAGPATLNDTRGPMLLTFNHASAAPFLQKLRVISPTSWGVEFDGNVSDIDAFWEYLLSSIGVPDSIGKLIKDWLDIPVSAAGGRIEFGTAQAGAANTITLQATSSSVDNFHRYKRLVLLSGTGAGQSAVIESYVGSTKVATIRCEGPNTVAASWFTNPDSTTKYVILPRNR